VREVMAVAHTRVKRRKKKSGIEKRVVSKIFLNDSAFIVPDYSMTK